MALTLEAEAVHAMRRNNGSKELVTIGVVDPSKLTDRTSERFIAYIERIEQRTEAEGKARAAWWANDTAPSELERLVECELGKFGTAAEAAMKRLFDLTPGTGSEVLALFVRALRDGDAS